MLSIRGPRAYVLTDGRRIDCRENLTRENRVRGETIANKILTREELRQRVAEWRRGGDSITLANGGFGLVHVGHARYLRAAKQLGGRLNVAVTSDASLRARKGQGRPRLLESGRAGMKAA